MNFFHARTEGRPDWLATAVSIAPFRPARNVFGDVFLGKCPLSFRKSPHSCVVSSSPSSYSSRDKALVPPPQAGEVGAEANSLRGSQGVEGGSSTYTPPAHQEKETSENGHSVGAPVSERGNDLQLPCWIADAI